MPTITLSVPEELKKEMDKHKIMNWSAIAREAIKEKLIILNKLDKILEKSKFTEKDALELGRKVNKALHERYKKEHPEAY